MLSNLVKRWRRYKDRQDFLNTRALVFIEKSRARLDIMNKITVAIKSNNLPLAKELDAELDSMPCPYCNK
jgi:hypothetical protein